MSLLTANHNLISGTLPAKPFITEWTVPAGTTITIPHVSGYIHNYLVDYGDGTPLKHVTAYDSPNASHTYANAGIYNVKIYGTCGSFYVNNGAMKSYITAWNKFGFVKLRIVNFYGCSNMTRVPDDGTLHAITCMGFQYLLKNCSGIVDWGDISYWDTRNVTTMHEALHGTLINQSLNWNTGKCTSMYLMLYNCINFNSDLNFTDTSKVVNMQSLLYGCTVFNKPLNFNTSAVTNMAYMLYGCSAFDQDISALDVGKVANFTSFLQGGTLSAANYDALLIAWQALDLVNGLTAHFGNSKYTTAGQTAKNSIIADDGWTFIDGGLA